jgi:hypothetical protein
MAGLEPNVLNGEGATPLHAAARNGQLEVRAVQWCARLRHRLLVPHPARASLGCRTESRAGSAGACLGARGWAALLRMAALSGVTRCSQP